MKKRLILFTAFTALGVLLTVLNHGQDHLVSYELDLPPQHGFEPMA